MGRAERQYRYQTLLALKSPLDVELKLMDSLAIEFLKTYQVWHHRRLILTALHDSPPSASTTSYPSARDAAKSELGFITRALLTDTKNYHTWSYRQWLLAFFDLPELWSGELDYLEVMLKEDVRNNSAWHHRFFVVFGRVKGGTGVGGSGDVLKRELAYAYFKHLSLMFADSMPDPFTRYTKDQIALAPNNPSAWNYLRGVLEHTSTPFSSLENFVQLYISAKPPVQEVFDLENPAPGPDAELPCIAALEFYADIQERRGGKENIEKAVEVWTSALSFFSEAV